MCRDVSKEPLLLISAYMPCRGLRKNVDEFQDCLAQVQDIIIKTQTLIGFYGGAGGGGGGEEISF